MAIPYASTDDPLVLGTNVHCIDHGGIEGFEPDNRGDIPGTDGRRYQTSIRGFLSQGTVRYNPLATMSWSSGSCTINSVLTVYPGMTTSGGPIVIGAKPGKTNQGEDTLDVTVEAYIKQDVDHVW